MSLGATRNSRPIALIAALVIAAALLMAAVTHTARTGSDMPQAGDLIHAGKTVKGNPKRR